MSNQGITVSISQLPPLAPELLSEEDSVEITIRTRTDEGAGYAKKSYRVKISDILRIYGNRRDNPNKVTAEQVGTYTYDEIRILLEGKLGVGAVAVNSMKLDGKTRQEIVEDIRAGSVNNAENLGGRPSEDYVLVQQFDMSVTDVTNRLNELTKEITIPNVGEP